MKGVCDGRTLVLVFFIVVILAAIFSLALAVFGVKALMAVKDGNDKKFSVGTEIDSDTND